MISHCLFVGGTFDTVIRPIDSTIDYIHVIEGSHIELEGRPDQPYGFHRNYYKREYFKNEPTHIFHWTNPKIISTIPLP